MICFSPQSQIYLVAGFSATAVLGDWQSLDSPPDWMMFKGQYLSVDQNDHLSAFICELKRQHVNSVNSVTLRPKCCCMIMQRFDTFSHSNTFCVSGLIIWVDLRRLQFTHTHIIYALCRLFQRKYSTVKNWLQSNLENFHLTA